MTCWVQVPKTEKKHTLRLNAAWKLLCVKYFNFQYCNRL